MNKIILITGSTDGIGKLAAEKLAHDGHHILIHGRNNEKAQNTVKELKQKTNNKNIEAVIADLSNFKSVNDLCNTIKASYQNLDVLINNAGVFKSNLDKTPEGIDLRFMVNYIAPYYLSKQLLPLLKDRPDARIINLSSAAQASVSLDALQGNQNLDSQSAYAQSKLALTMWSFDLSKKREALTVIPVNPGSLLNTKMVMEAYGKFWSSASKGANIIHQLATAPEHQNNSGKYFDNDLGDPLGRFGEAHQDAYDDKLIQELIDTTEQIVEKLS